MSDGDGKSWCRFSFFALISGNFIFGVNAFRRFSPRPFLAAVTTHFGEVADSRRTTDRRVNNWKSPILAADRIDDSDRVYSWTSPFRREDADSRRWSLPMVVRPDRIIDLCVSGG